MKLLPAPILGSIAMLMFVLNLSLWIIPLYLLAIIKLLVPVPYVRNLCVQGLEVIGESWIWCNRAMINIHDIDFDIRGVEGLKRDDWYLIGSNHQNWNDVFMLQVALNRKVPFLRFFLKKQLIWVPLLGLAWWAFEMPFMKRHSREEIAANPKLREEDLETTRIACEKLRQRPSSIINFLEGTRFTEAKHDAQQSPYTYLLKPKAGGLAFTLAALGDQMQNYLDVTIVYPGKVSFWDFLCGRMKKVIIKVQHEILPDWIFEGDYLNDNDFRERFQNWVNAKWQAKDAEMKRLTAEMASFTTDN